MLYCRLGHLWRYWLSLFNPLHCFRLKGASLVETANCFTLGLSVAPSKMAKRLSLKNFASSRARNTTAFILCSFFLRLCHKVWARVDDDDSRGKEWLMLYAGGFGFIVFLIATRAIAMLQLYNHACKLVRAKNVSLQIVLYADAVTNTPNTNVFRCAPPALAQQTERTFVAAPSLRRLNTTRLRRAGQELRTRMQRLKRES